MDKKEIFWAIKGYKEGTYEDNSGKEDLIAHAINIEQISELYLNMLPLTESKASERERFSVSEYNAKPSEALRHGSAKKGRVPRCHRG